jgi:hypothetical protein
MHDPFWAQLLHVNRSAAIVSGDASYLGKYTLTDSSY